MKEELESPASKWNISELKVKNMKNKDRGTSSLLLILTDFQRNHL